MEEFWANLRQNPFTFYFVIIFSVLWLGGILWAAILIIKSISKSKRFIETLKTLHFEKIGNRRDRIERVKDICERTLCRNFGKEVEQNPRDELLRVTTDDEKIIFRYAIPENEYRKLSGNIGLKQEIQVVSRELILSNILYRYADSEAFLAQTSDTRVIRSYRPSTHTKNFTGWVLCFPKRIGVSAFVSIHKKFTGSRRYLMNFAYMMAQVKLPEVHNLLPEFSDEFAISSADASANVTLDENVQRAILEYKNFIPEGMKIFLDKEGVWLTGDIWLDGKATEQMIHLCQRLLEVA